MLRAGISKLIAGLCLFAAAAGVYMISRGERFVLLPAAVALALCGWAVFLSLLSRQWRQRLLIAGGVAFLVGAAVAMAASVLLSPSAANIVAAVALLPIGVGGLLVIGVVMTFVGAYAWDTFHELVLFAPAWTRMVFRRDLPPDAPNAARDRAALRAQMRRMHPAWAETVERFTQEPSGERRPIRLPRSPDGPWWQRVLGITAKGYIATACALLFAWLISLLFLLPDWLQRLLGGLIGVAPVVGAVLLLPLVIAISYALAAPVVLLVRDWRERSPLRRWWARGLATGCYSGGLALLVAGGSLLLFDRSFAWGALLFFGALAAVLVAVGLLGGMVAALLGVLLGRTRARARERRALARRAEP